jgi:hypothetical protein
MPSAMDIPRRACRREAEAQIDTIKIVLSVACRFCGTNAEFKFRPSVRIAPTYQIAANA